MHFVFYVSHNNCTFFSIFHKITAFFIFHIITEHEFSYCMYDVGKINRTANLDVVFTRYEEKILVTRQNIYSL